MNEKLRKAMRSVFDELTGMSSEELIEEINNVPQSDIGASLAYAGAHEVLFDGGAQKGLSYQMELIGHEPQNAADYKAYYCVEDMIWLMAA